MEDNVIDPDKDEFKITVRRLIIKLGFLTKCLHACCVGFDLTSELIIVHLFKVGKA